MNINELHFDTLQYCFSIALTTSDKFDEGCKVISSISRVCKNWREIIYERIEPVKALYDRFFTIPLVLFDGQLQESINENVYRLSLFHRLSIEFYFHLDPDDRPFQCTDPFYLKSKFVPIINNKSLYRIGGELNLPKTDPLEADSSEDEEIEPNPAQILINSENLTCLEIILNSGVSVINPYKMLNNDHEDNAIDATLDLFLLALKKAVFSDIKNLEDLEDIGMFKQILLLMKDFRFHHYQNSNFFFDLRNICFNKPDTFSSIGLWKLIEKNDPKNLALNVNVFFDFLVSCESKSNYSEDQLREIYAFVESLIKQVNLDEVSFLEEIVHHSFFPIVLKNIKNKKDWYRVFLECLSDEDHGDYEDPNKKEIHLKNATHLLEVIKKEHNKNRTKINTLDKNPKDIFQEFEGKNSQAIYSMQQSSDSSYSEESVSDQEMMNVDVEEYSQDLGSDLEDENDFLDGSFNGYISGDSLDSDDAREPPAKKARKK